MTRFKFCLVSLLILIGFSVGWRTSTTGDTAGFEYPINMTLADTLLLVSDAGRGVHVYDVTDPETPRFKYLIPMDGNRGAAVKGDILYASDHKSLMTIRIEADAYTVVDTIVLWETQWAPMPMFEGARRGWGCGCYQDEAVFAPTANGGSVGSSYATFTIIDSYLYYFHLPELVTMDISRPDKPVELSRTMLDWGVETLYPTDRYLFVGGARGMYIYDRKNPASPVEVGRIEHFRACDPVVVSGDRAYVTLRGGNECGQSGNELLVVDIANPAEPVLKSATAIATPYGLAVNDPYLYVGGGHNGFELFSVADPDLPSLVVGWSQPDSKDFIWVGEVLYMLGFDDVKIYDVTRPAAPVLLSVIE